MQLSSGTKLGHYEILAPVGAGGMGEVYRARDSHLPRFVAIKILPKTISADTEHKQRFEREARVLASINHPNILSFRFRHNFLPAVIGGLLNGKLRSDSAR